MLTVELCLLWWSSRGGAASKEYLEQTLRNFYGDTKGHRSQEEAEVRKLYRLEP